MKIEITRLEIFIGLKDSLKLKNDQFFAKLLSFIKHKYGVEIDLTQLNPLKLNSMKEQARMYLIQINAKLDKHNRHQQRILDNEKVWFADLAFVQDFNKSELLTNGIAVNETAFLSPLQAGPGRPKLPFSSQSNRSKDRAALVLSNQKEHQHLFSALKKSAKKNRKSLARVLNRLETPGSATSLNDDLIKATSNKPIVLTPETALALLAACDLSRDDYQKIRNVAKNHNADIFPCYHKVLEAKKSCYPENISFTETTAQQPLQDLLDHTSKRLINSEDVKKRIVDLLEPNLNGYLVVDLCLYGKWGFDGATGQSVYKQRFNLTDSSDKSLFSTMFVPLKLRERSSSMWTNPVPSSTRFCRPIQICYEKESKELSQRVRDDIENQIKNLNKSVVRLLVNDLVTIEVRVSFNLRLTMIDGKVANAISSNLSAQVCNICKASPKQMNDKEVIKALPCDPTTLNYGLSALHAYIRCFECILHISTSIDNQKLSNKRRRSYIEVQ